MTVGELIEKLSEFPKQVSVEFLADIPMDLRSILRVEDISFNTDISPDDILKVEILLKEVGKVLPLSMVSEEKLFKEIPRERIKHFGENDSDMIETFSLEPE